MNGENRIEKDPRAKGRLDAGLDSGIEAVHDGGPTELDTDLKEALGDFRLSVHAWSEAAYNRPRTALSATPRNRSLRLAATWALGCALVAGAVSGGVFERHHRQEMAQIAAAKATEAAEQQRLIALRRAQEEEELLAKVDSEVSQEVPSAMEPLAQLMVTDTAEDGTSSKPVRLVR